MWFPYRLARFRPRRILGGITAGLGEGPLGLWGDCGGGPGSGHNGSSGALCPRERWEGGRRVGAGHACGAWSFFGAELAILVAKRWDNIFIQSPSTCSGRRRLQRSFLLAGRSTGLGMKRLAHLYGSAAHPKRCAHKCPHVPKCGGPQLWSSLQSLLASCLSGNRTAASSGQTACRVVAQEQGSRDSSGLSDISACWFA